MAGERLAKREVLRSQAGDALRAGAARLINSCAGWGGEASMTRAPSRAPPPALCLFLKKKKYPTPKKQTSNRWGGGGGRKEARTRRSGPACSAQPPRDVRRYAELRGAAGARGGHYLPGSGGSPPAPRRAASRDSVPRVCAEGTGTRT